MKKKYKNNEYVKYLLYQIKCTKSIHREFKVFVMMNGYDGRFTYTKDNLIKYISYLINSFKEYKNDVIYDLNNRQDIWLTRPTKDTFGDMRDIDYWGNNIRITTIPKILYVMWLKNYIKSDVVIRFVLENIDYYRLVGLDELLFISSIANEKEVVSKRKRKEK